jgi:hypothetical protein
MIYFFMDTKPTRYIGQDCPQGHGGERYSSNWKCVRCHQIKKQAAKKAKRLANPKKRGRPPKPESEKVKYVFKLSEEALAKRRQYQKEYWAKPENAGKKKAKRAKNRAKKELRIPAWLSKDDIWMIKEAYDLATERTKLFGFRWDVDHIIPMKGKLISGLHVPTNLQVIPHTTNVRKSNKYEVA